MNNTQLDVSLIISTYNWPQALRLCLMSVKALKKLPDEVIIADDGSTDDTRLLIEEFAKNFPVPLIHVWQPDEGFQLARIRNKGIAAASGRYIIQVDGDLILHPYFVADHIRFRQPDTFVTGSRVIIDKPTSERLIGDRRININLLSSGIKNRSNGLRSKLLSNYLAERYRQNDPYFMRGCNMAFWRSDLVKVNGYNEAFTGWGREDNEIAIRLINTGLKKRVIKFAAVVFHLYHPQKSRSDLDRNDDILQETITQNKKSCELGLNQYTAL
ncbi:glycosyltransferase family 2 protein [Mucilaginibacter sp.]|uniref:glycosyltransferase family 2 protein n=1 Tax=Mucilaginibacter sp. TaxID=1882438 RepID=UPI000CA89629|nr:glycosyltransferase family 2 protein [Mucilaginibacter sp.]PLW88459.1 MAG: glycosyl transferase family 2 [Mucilaginibacter sp.]HEK20318.1 glycosyltransferase [Bacteroidota bacterium]